MVDGVNLDDLGDHRPGIEAARQAGVRSPLAELAIDKAAIRQLSSALGFPWWDKPAQPCLASRFPYGESISAERLKRVGQAEAWLLARGFPRVRVRSQGLSARIEVPRDRLDDLLALNAKEPLVSSLLDLGFTSVSLDLEGLVSGKLNRRPLISQAAGSVRARCRPQPPVFPCENSSGHGAGPAVRPAERRRPVPASCGHRR